MGWDLSGRTILVTGAARGIGAESARQLASRGARLALVGLEPEELERVARQCGSDAAWFEADVTDADALERAVADALERFGGLDAVMANAGIEGGGTIRAVDPAAFDRVIEVNLMGAWRTVRACLPYVIERRGYVLVVASMAVVAQGPGMASYNASKAGVEAFTNSLRSEVRHLGVDVGCAYFAFIDTDMVIGSDSHPSLGFARDELPGPIGRKYPVSRVGRAVADGIERRRSWVVVPGWVRALLLLRGPIQWLGQRASTDIAARMDEAFMRDVEQRGAAEASTPVGAGGRAGAKRD
jgi:NAD(P)-dependent dehydrogenase (short-subunit alcohol dehydrogenase family)